MKFWEPYISSPQGKILMSQLKQMNSINKCKINQMIEYFEPENTDFYVTKNIEMFPVYYTNASEAALYGFGLRTLQYLCECIKCSPIDSLYAGFVYVKCAEICADHHMFEDCLRNMNLAKNFEIIPSSGMLRICQQKYDRRYHLLRNSYQSPKEQLKMSYRQNKNMPSFVYCLEYVPKKGIRTKKDLKPGDIVAMEKPFVSVNMNNNFCDYFPCGKQMFTFIPCETCSLVCYCSEACRQKAHDLYHQYICSFKALNKDIILILSIVALKKFDHATLRKLLKTPNSNAKINKIHFTAANNDLSMYKCILSINIVEHFSNDFSKMNYVRILLILSLIRKRFTKDELDLLYDLLKFHSFNSVGLVNLFGPTEQISHSIASNVVIIDIERRKEKICIYGLLSLIEIDERPNICMIKHDDITFARVIRPILKGQYLKADLK